MSLRKNKKDKQGPPQRKSLAGPAMLGTFTAPGATRRSMVFDHGVMAGIGTPAANLQALSAPVKDYTGIEGRIKIVSVTDVGKEILCCKYNEEYNYIACGCSNGQISVYTAGTNHFIETLIDADLQNATAPVTGIQTRPVSKSLPVNHTFVCTYANGFVKCWNYNFKQCIFTIKESRECFGLTYHPRYPKFITYGDDSKIYLYDEETRTQERVLSSSNNPKVTDGHTSRVFAACFNPRSNYELITGGWDDVVHFWDLRQPHAIRHISGIHICGEGLDINARGTEVLTCAFQKEHPFRVWDYASGKLIASMENKEDEPSKLYTGKFVSKEYAVCGGTAPNLFQVVDLSSYMNAACVLGLPSAVYSLDIGKVPEEPEKKEGAVSTLHSDFASMPPMSFVSGKKVYQISFY